MPWLIGDFTQKVNSHRNAEARLFLKPTIHKYLSQEKKPYVTWGTLKSPHENPCIPVIFLVCKETLSFITPLNNSYSTHITSWCVYISQLQKMAFCKYTRLDQAVLCFTRPPCFQTNENQCRNSSSLFSIGWFPPLV